MRRTVAAAAAVLAVAASAAASIVLRATPRELADHANLVVEGRVATVEARWDLERTAINTYVAFDVHRVLKGEFRAAQVTVKVFGGKVDDEECLVQGVPKFSQGEDAVVFLWKDGRGEYVVLGEAQGKFRLYDDPKEGRRMARNSLDGLCLVFRRTADGKKPGAEVSRPDTLAYDDLAEVVRASVADAEAKKREGAKTPATTGGTAAGPATTTPAPPASQTTGSGAKPPGSPPGQDPVPPAGKTPDPPTTTPPPSGGAPPPSRNDPAPPAGKPAQEQPPAPR